MHSGLTALMQITCADWCLGQSFGPGGEPISITDFIPEGGTVSADEFTEWAFMAAGIDPNDDTAVWRRARVAIREAFIRHLGASSVDASALHWRANDGSRQLPLSDPEAYTRNLTDDELISYEAEFGSASREWVLARRELSRRRGVFRHLWRWVAKRAEH